jgi:tetratricopeptide (TPR) repeat protein
VAENPRIEELRRRVQADPASIAFAALAEEFRRVGRHQDAIETCRTGLQRHPAYLSARVTLGRALIETGEYAEAREELETVLRSAPENLAATRGLEQINERLGHSTEMHPDLHEMMKEPIRIAASQPPPAPPAPAPAALDTIDVALAPPAVPESPEQGLADNEPFDIFAAALAPAASRPAEPPVAVQAPAIAFDPPPIAFEHATIAFEAPVSHIEPVLEPRVPAALLRLERLLDAIQIARHS